ncbi:MAG TPA: hypothetical protein VLI93_02145 [Acetobacteraceae bacterium]|nr:hypothetical protein [Acetobacteraceae bacterium]
MDKDDSLKHRLAERLARELADAALGRELASIIAQDALCWQPPEIAPDRVRAIFAFTFGNRMLANGNRTPGPVNEKLADCAAALHAVCGAPVFARWEIAEALAGRVPATTIFPGRDARGEPVYLGTAAVVADITARIGAPAALGPVGVIAFRDHLFRAVSTSRRAGFDAFAPADLRMPAEYDPGSGQRWCRSRMAYLLHDLMLRFAERRAAIVGAGWS